MKSTQLMLKNSVVSSLIILLCALRIAPGFAQQTDPYTQRFLDLREKLYNPANGYFSADGVPYHSVETLICEAPDYGHESTSEMFSYWIWLEAMYGRITSDWTPLNAAWNKLEAVSIPTQAMQPTAGNYNPSSPATYAGEHQLPSGYPSPLESGVPVGRDPVSGELTATYGNSFVYGMHWLFDLDNFYGYGNLGDGVSTPSYINTFQRGEQESVWETVPHPSWEDFSWGGNDGYGFLKLFINDQQPAAQWRYTNAPDADARAVQAIYWAAEFAKEQGVSPNTLPLQQAKKMGDYLRLAMFDKYFKPMGVQSKSAPGATGYESAHYLMSWYYAWGGPIQNQNWAWRIGCSHNHFGYQNPVAAYALSEVPELKPNSPNGARDWGVSLERQLEFYQWLQSAEGAIAGGATNSWNGSYEPYPAGKSTFYGMAYDDHPVYHDPGSNTWFGWQAWSMERVAEYYYITNNQRAKSVMDKWIAWVKSEVELVDGTYRIPVELSWTGQPATWNPAAPGNNSNLHVTVVDYNQDVGIAACLSKTLIYYAAATARWGTLDTEARDLAKEILDRMWTNYYEPNGLGVAVAEKRGDFKRFFEQEVYIPQGWSGQMANGDVIEPGVKFIDIRTKYRDDPDWPRLEAAYNAGQDYVATYHRFWAQVDVALANAEYARFFLEDPDANHAPIARITASSTSGNIPLAVSFSGSASTDPDGDALTYTWDFGDGQTGTGAAVSHTFTVAGTYSITLTVSDGELSDDATITITATEPGSNTAPIAVVSATPSSGNAPLTVSFNAGASSDADNDPLTFSWNFGDGTTGTGVTVSHVYAVAGTYSAVVTVSDGELSDDAAVTITVNDPTGTDCDNPTSVSLPHAQNGAGEFCWVTSGNISFVNSWNMTLLEINGVDYTNTWSNSMPPRIDGNYYIRYVATVGWAHAEINGSGGGGDPQQFTVTTSVTGSGSVSINPPGGTYNEGTAVTLTATPAAGFQFTNWSGGASGSANPLSVTVNTNLSITANFTEISEPDQFTLTTSVTGSGSVTLSPPGGVYDEGTVVTLTATPAANFTFSGWSGAVSGTTNPVTITMDGNKSVTAAFTSNPGNPTCTGAVTISLPFARNGTGESCFVTTGNISYINSWNTTLVEVNGVNFTNVWSNSLPPRINGAYYIRYVGAYGWSHFEAAGSNAGARVALREASESASADLIIYPNPSGNSFTIRASDEHKIQEVEVYDGLGKKVTGEKISDPSGNAFSFGGELKEGIYFVRIIRNGEMIMRKIIKE